MSAYLRTYLKIARDQNIGTYLSLFTVVILGPSLHQ